MIKHEHLKTLLEDIFLNDNKLTEDYSIRLINELRYSNLIIPASRENDTLNFIIYQIDDLNYTPLFTDRDEFNKFYKGEDIRALDNPFEIYQNIIKTKEIDGFILNPSSQKYLIDRELILSIKPPKLNNFTLDALEKDSLKEIYDSIDNQELGDFIKNPNNIGNYQELFEMFSKSTLLTLMVSANDLSGIAEDNVISMTESGPLAFMHVDKVGGEYATIYSAKEKLRHVNMDSKLSRYAQIINISTLVNYVLCEDMDGLILNPDSDNILISRAELLKNSHGFEKFCNDERLSNAIFYLFLL